MGSDPNAAKFSGGLLEMINSFVPIKNFPKKFVKKNKKNPQPTCD